MRSIINNVHCSVNYSQHLLGCVVVYQPELGYTHDEEEVKASNQSLLRSPAVSAEKRMQRLGDCGRVLYQYYLRVVAHLV